MVSIEFEPPLLSTAQVIGELMERHGRAGLPEVGYDQSEDRKSNRQPTSYEESLNSPGEPPF